MLENKNNPEMTLIINTCDKFSDIWEIQCSLLEKNWNERNVRTILLTDRSTDFQYQNVDVLCAGDGLDMVDRLRFAMERIDTEFIFVTLDDYFLIQSANSARIKELTGIMHRDGIDYMRLYEYPKSRQTTKLTNDGSIRKLTFDKRYDVNLYPGIWRKCFLEKTLSVPGLNAWEYEVSLTQTAIQNNALCAWCMEDVYPILDAVRKGCFLHAAKKFIRSYGHYSGNRPTIAYQTEIKLACMRWVNTCLPDDVRVFLKRTFGKNMKFFSSN